MSLLAALALAAGGLVAVPADPQALCPAQRVKLYAGCMDQRSLFIEGFLRARAEEKVLLVSFGAEWCIWCHVIDAELTGLTSSAATPEEEATAAELADYAAAHFVIVRIDAEGQEGAEAVLDATGGRPHFPGGIPFLFTVDRDGQYVASLRAETTEIEDSLGRPVHDRAALLELLRALVPAPEPEKL